MNPNKAVLKEFTKLLPKWIKRSYEDNLFTII